MLDSTVELKPSEAPLSITPADRPTEDFLYIIPGIMGNVEKHAVERQGEGFRRYEISDGNGEKPRFIVWWNNISYTSMYEAIPHEDWQGLLAEPQIISDVDQMLLEAQNSAQNFYPWSFENKGISIVNSRGFGFEKSGPIGLRASYPGEIKPLIKALREGDKEELARIETHLAASLVHEYIHLEREDGLAFGNSVYFEMVTHIGQFLYDPKNNAIFNEQVSKILDGLKKDGLEGNTKVYHNGIYIALTLIAADLLKLSPKFKEIFDNDQDPLKLDSLGRMHDFIDDQTRNRLIETVLKRAMTMEGEDILEESKAIRTSWSQG